MGLTLLLLAAVASATVLGYTLKLGIGPHPTSSKVWQAMEHLLPEGATRVVDLGSGWGTLTRRLQRQYPDARVTGYELSPIPYLISLCQRSTTIYRQDFFKAHLSDHDLVVCYLYRRGMADLSEKLARELRPGCFVVSHTFALPGWRPVKQMRVKDLYQTPIYLYQVD